MYSDVHITTLVLGKMLFLRYNKKNFAPEHFTYKRDLRNHHLQTVDCNISPAHFDERQIFHFLKKIFDA